jgi:hypothetical protein
MSLCDRLGITKAPSTGVSGRTHAHSTSSAKRRTENIGFCPCQAENVWRVLADFVHMGTGEKQQTERSWNCYGSLLQDNRTAQGDLTSQGVVTPLHTALRIIRFETLTVSCLIIKFPVFYGT